VKTRTRIALFAPLLCYTLCLSGLSGLPAYAGSKWDSLKKAGDAAYEAGNYDKAEEQFRAALKEAQNFEPDDKRLATTSYNLALVLQTEEKFDEAAAQYKTSIDLLTKAFGADHEKVAGAWVNLAEILKLKDDLKGAEENYQKALAIYEKCLGDTKPEMADALDTVADFYAEQEEYAKAEPLYKRALDISRKQLGDDKYETAKRMAHLAEVYCVQAKYAPAEPLFVQALDITEKAKGKDSLELSKIAFNMGGLHYDQGHFPAAEKYFKHSIEIARKLAPQDVPMMEASLGDVLDMQGKHAEAETVYKGAIAALEKTSDANGLINCLTGYRKHLNMDNKKDEAKQVGVRIKELKAKAAAAGS
jgi:tetratricopeptide (TPR) repeat protein